MPDVLDNPRIRQLSDDVIAYVGYSTTGLVSTPDGVVAVDGPYLPEHALVWRDVVRHYGDLRFLVYGEHHEDHTTAAYYLEPEFIIATEQTKYEMQQGQHNVMCSAETWGVYPDKDLAQWEGWEPRLPTITYNERLNFELGGKRFVAFHAPGHTKGSSALHAIDDNVVFCSDNLLPYPHTPMYHSGDPWGNLRTLAHLEALNAEWYIPGHGEPFKREAIHSTRLITLRFIEKIADLKAKGWSVDRVNDEGDVFSVDPEHMDLPGFLGGYEAVAEEMPPTLLTQVGSWARRRTIWEVFRAIDTRHPTAGQLDTYDLKPHWFTPGAAYSAEELGRHYTPEAES